MYKSIFAALSFSLLFQIQAALAEEKAWLPEQLSAKAIQKPFAKNVPDALRKLLANAQEQTFLTKSYTSTYRVLSYPNGDVPIETGVCSDVVVRAFRKAGIDLQQAVHEDMAKHFSQYPHKWGLKFPDANIDHRRVPNLQTFFTRKGKSLPINNISSDYLPGDVIAWDLNGNGLSHIGLVSNLWSEASQRFLIIHNIGNGTRAEDRIFDWKITGHYRYF